jgi:hypothetical protein
MCISIFDMCAANQAGEARHDSVGLVGGSLRHYRSVAGIRDQCGRASTIKLSKVGSHRGLDLTGDLRPMRSLTPARRLHKQDELWLGKTPSDFKINKIR